MFNLGSAYYRLIITVSECCLIKLLPYILFKKCINIFALEMASPGNRHCASCIGTLSFALTSTFFHLLTPLATRPCVSKTLMLSVNSDVAIEIGDEAK